MEVIALLLAGAGIIAGFTLPGLTKKDQTGIAFLAAVVAAVAIFVLASSDWVMDPSWLIMAALPLIFAALQSYKSKSRRPL